MFQSGNERVFRPADTSVGQSNLLALRRAGWGPLAKVLVVEEPGEGSEVGKTAGQRPAKDVFYP